MTVFLGADERNPEPKPKKAAAKKVEKPATEPEKVEEPAAEADGVSIADVKPKRTRTRRTTKKAAEEAAEE